MATNDPLWHPSALEEAAGARDWYAERSPQAARGFLLALEDALQAVMMAPERWPVVGPGRRVYVFPSHYPYNLIYRFDGQVKIIAISHQSRQPQYWRNRR